MVSSSAELAINPSQLDDLTSSCVNANGGDGYEISRGIAVAAACAPNAHPITWHQAILGPAMRRFDWQRHNPLKGIETTYRRSPAEVFEFAQMASDAALSHLVEIGARDV